MTALPVLGVLGGTGHEGSGLALRWANAGYSVTIGSRNADRAVEVARELNELRRTGVEIRGADNQAAAERASVVVLTVPFSAQRATAEDVKDKLKGKILVDVTAPLVPPAVGRVQLPEGGSAAVLLQKALGDDVKVVSAFQNVSASHLRELDHAIDCDVLVCGDSEEAREVVCNMARAAGLRGLHAGVLANSAAAEALTSVLIAINRRYKSKEAGIRISGLQL